MAATPVIPVAVLLGGAYLAWFGVHYWRTDVAWPSDPVKAVLTGKPLPDGTRDDSALLTASVVAPGVAAGQLGAAAVPPAGGTLGKQDLMTLWTANGGDPAVANVAAAVALAESSGRPGATSSNPDGGVNVGLWQLDTRGVGAGHTITELADPATNARVTVMGSTNGTNWSAWQTYVQGTYKQFL